MAIRIGLMGGMFDPPHSGHLSCIRQAASKFDLDKIILIPSNSPPHKGDAIATPEQRMEMTTLSVDGFPIYSVSDMEVKRKGSSYTIDTLRHMKKETDGELFFITGADAFAEVSSWRSSDELFPVANFIVIARPSHPLLEVAVAVSEKMRGLKLEEDKGDLFTYSYEGTDNKIYFYKGIELPVSSTELRRQMLRGEFHNETLPRKVAAYIKEKGIYSR